MPSNFFFYVSVGHYQSLTVESARKKVLWENNLDQDRTSKRYTCVCCCIFSTRSLMYLRMGTHDRVWSRHTLTQPKATPSPVIWFELFLTSWMFSLSLHITAIAWARGTQMGPLPTSSHETLPGLSLLLLGHGDTRLGPGSLAPGLLRLQSLTPSSPSPPCWSFLLQLTLYIITQPYIILCPPWWVYS